MSCIVINESGGVKVFNINLIKADDKEAVEFKKLLLQSIDNNVINRIVIDLSIVQRIDVMFLGVLITGHKLIKMSAGGSIKIAGLQPLVHEMFELTRLNQAFDIYIDAQQAIKSF